MAKKRSTKRNRGGRRVAPKDDHGADKASDELEARRRELEERERTIAAREQALAERDAIERASLEDEDDDTVRGRREGGDRDRSRPSRDQESREGEQVHEETAFDFDTPTYLLEHPSLKCRPGYVQRWVRTHFPGGEADTGNMMRKHAQGWRPRMADTVPKDSFVPTIDHGGSQVIGIQGVILMERPERVHEAHKRATRQATRDLDEAVRNDLFRVHEPGRGLGAPETEGKTRVTRGRPRDTVVADD